MEQSGSAQWMVEGRAGSAAAIREVASRRVAAATSSAHWTSANDESRATTGGPNEPACHQNNYERLQEHEL